MRDQERIDELEKKVSKLERIVEILLRTAQDIEEITFEQ